MEDVRVRINNLRTYYLKEKRKTKVSTKSGAGAADVYISKWWLFSKLEFLSDWTNPRRTISNFQTQKVISIIILFMVIIDQ